MVVIVFNYCNRYNPPNLLSIATVPILWVPSLLASTNTKYKANNFYVVSLQYYIQSSLIPIHISHSDLCVCV